MITRERLQQKRAEILARLEALTRETIALEGQVYLIDDLLNEPMTLDDFGQMIGAKVGQPQEVKV